MNAACNLLVRAALQHGLLGERGLADVRRPSATDPEALARALALEGRFPLEALYRALGAELGLAYADVRRARPSQELLARLPRALARQARLLPLVDAEGAVQLATSDPLERGTLDAARRVLGPRCEVVVLEPEVLARLLERAPLGSAASSDAEVLSAVDAPALLDRLLLEAYLRRASDIHLEPTSGGLRVRMRCDGVLRIVLEGLGRAERLALISRVKVLADLDIAEQRAPQDGSFRHEPTFLAGAALEVRVASLPSEHGERLTLRLLGLERIGQSLEELGLEPDDCRALRSSLAVRSGLVLIAGPTGSGKTTTLYAALEEIDRESTNVLTVEDPIERRLEGVTQVRVGASDKLTFAGALRSFLRHDPDVILVGEIRDAETADVALKAAMTGHLVLSTVHTSTAIGAVGRLLDLGLEPYRIAAALRLVVAQRLVRRVCTACGGAREPLEHELAFLGSAVPLARTQGCPACVGTGHRGRIGLFELLEIDRALAAAIAARRGPAELEGLAGARLRPLASDARLKVQRRVVTLEEARSSVLEPHAD